MRLIKVIILFFALIILITMAIQAQAQNKTRAKATSQAAATFNAVRVIDSVLMKAKEIGLNAESVQWDSVRKQMYAKAFGATSAMDLKKSLESLLVALKDGRGAFYDSSTKNKIASHPATGDENVLTTPPEFHYAILEHGIRYIRVVGVSDDAEEVINLRDAVDSLMKGDANHWIVDLRYASGGDMKRLFAGMAPILDEGLVASSVNNKGQIVDMYTVHNGNFYMNQVRCEKFPPHVNDQRNTKVAVLTSRYTNGPAEILAIGLKGKRHTKVFGEPTAGNIFGMATTTFASTLEMKIAHTLYVNKKGIEYRHPIEPDVMIEFAAAGSIRHDEAIRQAEKWLKELDPVIKVANN